MRNQFLTPEKVYECVFTNQIEKIPESQYNFSTQKKYLDSGEYIMMSNGNRYYNLKRWIKERFIYCDTLFEYTPTTASYITIRSGVEGNAYLDIETYYPMYVTVEWRNQADGSGRQTLKVGRNKKVRFNGAVQAKDQEVLVYGAVHLKTVSGMDGIKPRHLLLNNAKKLTAVECPNNTELINIQMEQCSYLQTINLSGCSSLGTLTSSQVLDVSGCSNLRYLNVYGTVLTSINTNQAGGNLVEIYIPKSLQSLSLRNQYSLTTIGIPCSYYLSNTVNDIQNNASSLSTFSLINCPLVNRLSYNANYNTDYAFYDSYMNYRNNNEFTSLEDYSKWKQLAWWGNGLANATTIHIENSCHDIEHMSFRGTENLVSLTLRNLPNLKTLLLGANCSGCRWNNAPNYDADRYDLIGEFDWETFIIRDCPNIEEFRIHEFRVNQNQNWFTFKEGTNSINLAEKFPNLKLFECNMATQNIHQIILPQTLTTFMNTTWSGYTDTGYPHKWTHEKFNIDSIYFEGEHDTSYVGVDLGNHAMTDVRVTAPWTTEIIGLNIKNYYVNPVFNYYKEDGHETRPSVVPHGRIDISEFKWREVSNWFAFIDFTQSTCEIIYPTDWDAFLRNVTNASKMFYRCINPDFTWEFAMKFFPMVQSEGNMREMYAYAQLKEQEGYDIDAVEMVNSYGVAQYNYGSSPFRGTNLKYVKSVVLTSTAGCNGLFRGCNVVKVGDITCSGTNTWGGFSDCFRGTTTLIEVGNLSSTYANAIEFASTFNGCTNLVKVGEMNFKANNCDSAFRDCRVLTSEGLKLPNMKDMTNMNYMFYQDYALTTLDFPDIGEDMLSFSTMRSAFERCTSLTSITIGGNTLPNTLTDMRYAFGTTALSEPLPIPNDFTYDINMEGVCQYCDNMTDDTIYSVFPFRVTSISNAYQYCNGLLNPVIEVKSDNVYAYGVFRYCVNLKSIDINFSGRLLRSSNYFAEHCDNLETVNFRFPDSLTMHTDYYQTGVTYYNMFQYCQNLHTVNLDMSRLTNTNTKADFGGMFYQDRYIHTITGLDFTYLKPPAHGWGNGYGNYDWHNDSITYGGNYDELTTFEVTGVLQHSYNFRNITSLAHTKAILSHLDTVTSETLGLTYNVMDAIDDELNEYVDPELKSLALDAINRGWTFVVV